MFVPSHVNLNASGQYFRGPSWPRVRIDESRVCLVSGHPPLIVTVLLIGALVGVAALLRMGYQWGATYEIPVWVGIGVGGIVWLFGLAATVSMNAQPHLAKSRKPWVAIEERALSLPRSDLTIPRSQIVGFVFLGITIGGAHSEFVASLAIVRQRNLVEPAEAILIQFPYDRFALRSSHKRAELANIPHFGRYGLRVEQASQIREAADTLVQNRLIGRDKGTA